MRRLLPWATMLPTFVSGIFFSVTTGWAQPTGFTKLDDGPAVPGGVIVYTIEPNAPILSTVELVFTETVPAHTTFDAAASDPAWAANGCTDGAPAGTVCRTTVTVGPGGGLPAFAVRVSSPAPAGVSVINNTIFIETAGQVFMASRSTPLNAAPDLALRKDDVGTSAAPGSLIEYTLDYRNDGTQAATGVVLEETVPTHTTFDTGGASPAWSCIDGAPAGSVCGLFVGDLAGGGATGQALFAVRVDDVLPAGATEIANRATIFDDGQNGPDLNPTNNTSTDLTPLTEGAAPDLVIVADDVGTSGVPGGTTVYQLDFRNDGTQSASGVTLEESVPMHTVFDAADSTPGWTCTDGAPPNTSCLLDAGSLAGGGDAERAQFAVRVDAVLPPGVEAITNTASITDDGKNGLDLNPDNNQSTDLTPLTMGAAPDLVIRKDEIGATAVPGGRIDYVLEITNDGMQGATGVEIEETVPAETTYQADTSTPGWDCADGASAGTICRFTLGSVAGGGGGATVTFAVDVASVVSAGVTVISNSASVFDDGSNGPDLNPTNNTATDTTPLPDKAAAPDLVIAKDEAGTSAVPGGRIDYVLTVANDGTQGATGVVVEETVPAHTTFDGSASTPGWDCPDGSQSGTNCRFAIRLLADSRTGRSTAGRSNATITFTVNVVEIVPAGVSAITNTATVIDDGRNGPDLNPDNNVATDMTPLPDKAAAPDLVLSKDDVGTTATRGGRIDYILTIINDGTQGATGVVVEETVPGHTSFDAGTSTAGWDCSDGALAGTTCRLEVARSPAVVVVVAQRSPSLSTSRKSCRRA